MMRAPAIGLVLGALLLAGCANDTLLRWRPGAATGYAGPPRPPTLSVTSQAADPDSPLNVKTMKERPAAAYITALAENQKDPDKLRALMATPISKGGGDGDADDLPRVLVIDVQRNGVRPADRFTMTEVDVVPTTGAEGPDYLFTDYQAASTTNASISIGTVTITNQTTGTLSATPGFGAAFAQGTASYGVQSTNASTHNIAETSQLSVNASPKRVTVVRTGGEGIDLVGNTLVKLTLHLPEGGGEPIFIADTDLFENDGSAKPPEKAKVAVKASAFLPARDIYACAKLNYVDRRVTSGAEYRDEGKQSVDFVASPTPTSWQRFLIVPKSELRTALWIVMTLSSAGKPDAALMMDSGFGPVTLYFDNYDEAQQFRAWLAKEKSSSIGGHVLTKGGIAPIDHFDRLAVTRFDDTAADSPDPTCPQVGADQ